MRSLTLSIAAIAAIIFGSTAQAFYPVDGWWFNSEESGRGVNIEMQDDTMFVSIFHYGASGDQVWWVASGQYDDQLERFQSEFIATDNGQCPGCPWVSPDVVTLSNPTVTIDFISPLLATMTWAGGTTTIQRQYFAQFDIDDPRTFLLGEFHFTIGEEGNYTADWLTFDQLGEDSTSRFAAGTRRGTSRLALGEWVQNQGAFAILVDSSTNTFRLFNFSMTKDRMEGLSWTFDKSSEPTGPGLPFIAHRTASRSFVQTGIGPGLLASAPQSSKSAADAADTETALVSDRHLLRVHSRLADEQPAQAGGSETLGSDLAETALRLRARLGRL